MKPLFNITVSAALPLLWLFGASLCGSWAHAQSTPEDSTNVGVVVSLVEKNSEADDAGLQAGDRVLTWERGTEHGTTPSPLDFQAMSREQAPRGPVTLHGTRSGKAFSWLLKTDDWLYPSQTVWGLVVVGGWPASAPVIQRIQSLNKAGKFDELLEYCRSECAKLNREDGERPYARYLAASLLISAHRCTEATELLQSALAEKPAGPSYETVALYGLSADAKGYGGDIKAASGFWLQVKHEAEQLRSPSLVTAYSILMLALDQFNQSNFHQAAQLVEQAQAITNSLAPHSLFNARRRLFAGDAALNNDDFQSAETFTQEGLAIATAVRPTSNSAADAQNFAGTLAWEQGELSTAEKHFTQAIRIINKRNGDPQILGESWGWLARIEAERGNFVRAERFMARFGAIVDKRSNLGLLSTTLLNIAALKLQNGDAAQAAPLARKALDILRVIAPDLAFNNLALFVYGEALLQQGQLNNAEQVFGQMQTRLEAGKGDSRSSALYHYGMGQLFSQKRDYDRAEKELRSALDIFQPREPRSTYLLQALGALAAVEEHKGDVQSAMNYYSQAIHLMDSLSLGLDRSASIHFLAGRTPFSTRYANLLLQRGMTSDAFVALDHAHAQTLLQTLSQNKVNFPNRAPSELRLKDRRLESQLSALSEQRVRALAQGDQAKLSELDKKIAETSTDHDLVEAQMRAADQSYAFLTQPTPPTVRQIQTRLAPGTALLEYSLDKDGSLLLAMDRNRLFYYRLRPSSEIDKLVRLTYNKFSRAPQGKDAPNAELDLSDAILGPAAGFLKGHPKLLIVADGSLQYIPFAALPLPHGFDTTAPSVASLFEITNLPSASFLALPGSHANRAHLSNSIAVLADPVFFKGDPRVVSQNLQPQDPTTHVTATRSAESAPNSKPDDMVDILSDDTDDSHTRGVNLKRLLHSREEAAAIASISPKQNFIMAVDFNANRATALDPKVTGSRIIHFATHGVFDSKNPAMSGLVFSLVDKNGKPQAGFLGLDDIYRLHLSADLVVMSACETALGEEVKGEGLVGLTWGFIYAGAKSVVASLWRVDDASTAELMRIFYTGIEREGLTPPAALRKAQLAIAANPNWSAPYYWAGFVVQGQDAR